MATHVLDITQGLAPDDSGDVRWRRYADFATNDFFGDLMVLEFSDQGTKDGATCSFRVPENYVGTPVFGMYWTSTATSGDVEWDIDYRAVGGDDTESLDQATAQESLNVADDAPSATDELMKATVSATAGNFAAGDLVEVILSRDGSDAGDTMSASALLFGFYFTYADA